MLNDVSRPYARRGVVMTERAPSALKLAPINIFRCRTQLAGIDSRNDAANGTA